MKKDLVIIEHTLRKYYGSTNVYSVFFSSGGDKLDRFEEYELAKVALELARNVKWKVEINGYADEKGGPEENMALSKKRSRCVYDYLVADFGISSERLIVKTLDEEELLLPTSELSPCGLHRANRRVDMVIVK